jgi:hypothetical protein
VCVIITDVNAEGGTLRRRASNAVAASVLDEAVEPWAVAWGLATEARGRRATAPRL